ncbi:MAG: hypothetical protein EOM37_07305 [Proteobacteria bacterium]|jgi:hypothetical protein|nr:hypothetical protein [Alphaproteobacteria bacterium]NCC03837.1 hypothetical protein [Pseudomonadota bacterium]
MLGHKERVATLAKELNDKNLDIEQLGGRIRETEGPARVKPSLFARLQRWLEQLSSLKKKEADILSKITDIEKRHAALRATGQLPSFFRKHPTFPAMEDEPAPKPPRSIASSVIFFFILGVLTGRRRHEPSLRSTLRND